MASLQSILRRRPEVDEVEFELVRTKTLSRLTALSNGDPGTAEEETIDETAETGETGAVAVPGALGLPAPIEAEEPAAGSTAADEAGEERPSLVGVMAETAEPTATSWEHIVWVKPDGDTSEPADPEPEQPASAVTSTMLTLGPRAVPSSLWDGAETRATVAAADAAEYEAPVRVARPATRAKAKKGAAVAAIASCPYCALLLEPPPEASRRCTRCRQRIIVKRVEGRAVYLTEASLLVFTAQRRRNANVGRWTRDRERWLKGALAVGAPEARIARMTNAPLTEDSVRAAQTLYMTTVEKSYRTAKREHRWAEASRIKRDQAMLLFRFAGSPTPPPEDIVHLHREGAIAALRGIGEMAKDAQLVNATCCGICRADAGRAFRISHELRVPRLPHAGCPKGLCRCDWDLAIRDRDMVRRYLRRRPRPDQAASAVGAGSETDSFDDDAPLADARA
jgi:hypothetical protein